MRIHCVALGDSCGAFVKVGNKLGGIFYASPDLRPKYLN